MRDQISDDARHHTLGVADSTWLELATDMADVGRWVYHAPSGTCHIDDALQRLTRLSQPQPMLADHFFDRIHEDDRETVRTSLADAVETSGVFSMSFRFRRDDAGYVWLAGKGRPTVQDDGSEVVIGVTYDVTELHNAIRANRLLANEMAHRVKNVISLVSGIFRMAARGADNIDDLKVAFLGRLETLSSLNDLIFDSETRCVHLADLFRQIFGSLGENPRVTITLADFSLNGTAAQTIVLAINELMTNAVKYGALGAEDGSLHVEIAVDEGADTFDLKWVETVPSGIEVPSERTGFGMSVLTRMTRHTFDGAPEFEWRKDGLTFSCRWSAAEMSGRTGVFANESRLFEEAARATAAVDRGA